MSMNLNLRVGKERYELRQTPTWVTYLLMTGDNGVVHSEIKGRRTAGVLERYIQWVKQRDLDGIMRSQLTAEKRDVEIGLLDEYCSQLRELKGKKLTFYIQ